MQSGGLGETWDCMLAHDLQRCARRCAQVGAIQSAVYEREAEATGSRQRAARLEHRLGELEAGLAAKVPLGPGPT